MIIPVIVTNKEKQNRDSKVYSKKELRLQKRRFNELKDALYAGEITTNSEELKSEYNSIKKSFEFLTKDKDNLEALKWGLNIVIEEYQQFLVKKYKDEIEKIIKNLEILKTDKNKRVKVDCYSNGINVFVKYKMGTLKKGIIKFQKIKDYTLIALDPFITLTRGYHHKIELLENCTKPYNNKLYFKQSYSSSDIACYLESKNAYTAKIKEGQENPEYKKYQKIYQEKMDCFMNNKDKLSTRQERIYFLNLIIEAEELSLYLPKLSFTTNTYKALTDQTDKFTDDIDGQMNILYHIINNPESLEEIVVNHYKN